MPTPKRPAYRTPDGDRRANVKEHEAIRRDRPKPRRQTPLVMVEPAPASHWPTGTAWLDTSGE